MADTGPLLSDKLVLENMAEEVRYSLFTHKWRLDKKETLEPALKELKTVILTGDEPEWLKAYKSRSTYKHHEECNAVYLKDDHGYEIYICPKRRIRLYQNIDYAHEILLMFAHGILDCKVDPKANQRIYADSPLYWYLHGWAEERALTLAYNIMLPRKEFESKMIKYVTNGRLNTRQMAEDMGWPPEKLLSQARRLRIIEN